MKRTLLFASLLLCCGIVGCGQQATSENKHANQASPLARTQSLPLSDEHPFASDANAEVRTEQMHLPLASQPASLGSQRQAKVVAAWPDSALGHGPGMAGDRYASIVDNQFLQVINEPLSTFSIDVDTASYANTRRFLMQNSVLPPAGAVRVEELINYFTYDYKPPTSGEPFATHVEVAACPWQPGHRLVRVALKGKVVDAEERPLSNLVFLLDVSGSMQSPDKIELMKHGMQRLVEELGENDRVAIVVYAGASGLVMPSTSADQKATIGQKLQELQAGGSTNGGSGIQLAYQVARDNFIAGGINRVILATDGDFNVGTTSQDQLVELVEKEADSGVFLSVLGFGRGNLNDSMMEEISNRGNGNYAYLDTPREAEKVLVEQVGGTLVTIAKDVKIQVEFNPAEVASYRLIGYENRKLENEDFNDDKKDAGEIGAGHTVTALYQVVPADAQTRPASTESNRTVDPLQFQGERPLTEAAKSGQLLTLKIRYKQPESEESQLSVFPVNDEGHAFGRATQDFKFATAAAAFGMLLRDSDHKGNLTFGAVAEIAKANQGDDSEGYRAEFVKMVERADSLSGS